MKSFYSLLLLLPALLNAQTQIHPITQTSWNNTITADNTAIQNVIALSKTFMGEPKLTGINVSNNYEPIFSSTDKWDEGSWFRGYFTGNEDNPQVFYNLDTTIAQTQYWSSHPQPRQASKQVRAMIHYDNYFSSSSNSPTVIKGLRYLISQIQPNGGYIYWYTRESLNAFEQNDNVTAASQNRTHIYETGGALAALCEGYLYLKKNNLPLPDHLYETIVSAAENIYRKPINDNLQATVPDHDSPYYNADYNSPNYVAFGLWALSKAYKITQDCRYLNKIIELDNWFINHQSNDSICKGTWLYGEENYSITGQQVYHETKIVYHAIILRGLIESLDCIPKSNTTFRKNLSNAIKKSVNHLIDYRVNYNETNGFFGTLNVYSSDIACNVINNLANTIHYDFYYYDDIVECMSLLAYYTRFDTENFAQTEAYTLKKLLNIVSVHAQTRIDPNINGQGAKRAVMQMPSLAYYLDYTRAMDNNTKVFEVDNTNFFDSEKISKPVSLDFDHDGVRDEVAYFSTNGDKTFLNVAKMASDGSISSVKRVWESTGYPLELFSDRIVSGDFNRNGYFDDIAVMCDYGGGETRIHVFEGTGSEFIYSNQAQGWWKETGYYANLVGDRMVSGDFDGDGNQNDIAVFYKYGTSETKIHVFQGQADKSFKYLTANGWWQSNSYSTDNIISNIVSGSFDDNGIHDDIAVFYKNSNDATAVHVFKRMGSSFVFQQWWYDSGYPFNQFTNRIVSGNFYDGNKRDDIAVLYESDPGHTNLHLFQGKGDHFNYLGSTGYWASANYDSKKVKGKMVDFNIENNDKSRIFAMYNVSNKDSKLQVFKNNMYSTPPNFALNEVKDWWNNECGGDVNLQNHYVPSSISRMANKLLEKDTSDKIVDIKIYKDSGSYEVVSQDKIKSIQIFDFSGKMIQQHTGILSNRFRFGILKGNYIVKVFDINNKISTRKILD